MENRAELMVSAVIDAGATAAGAVSIDTVREYMTEKMAQRLRGMDIAPVSAIMAVFPYFTGRQPGNVALYARGSDYVAANALRLRRAAESLPAALPGARVYVTGNAYPLPAVQAARLAGLGVVGMHGLLLTEEYGSFVTIGALLTDVRVTGGKAGGYCEKCGECVRSCPTGALGEEGETRVFRKERCLSHITQMKAPEGWQRELLRGSDTTLGCDVCQLVCPRNARPALTPLPEYYEKRANANNPETA
ncbi:MAG: hypothetical protein LBI44_03620 [Oscillospiraceae bacterium]|jgi:epoxyqueuosine reductase|nr:hypothetical protein [Oscillospiraceae bacterium]